MIFAASHGECGAPWHDVFEALVGTEVETVHAAAERIIASGHTSGADALAGFVAVMRGGISDQN
jgi:DNA-binding ferritin-like protein